MTDYPITARAARQGLEGCGPAVRDLVLERFAAAGGSFDRWAPADLERLHGVLESEVPSLDSLHARTSLRLLAGQLELGLRRHRFAQPPAQAPQSTTEHP